MLFAQTPEETENKESLYFIGLEGGNWKIITKALNSEEYQVTSTDIEPRSACFNEAKQELAYIGADGALRHRVLGKGSEKIIYQPVHKESISQLFCNRGLDRLFMMYMPEGKSSDADIAELKNGKLSVVVKQLSSQFEPFLYDNKWLYYSNVHCLADCGHIIREIWRKNAISGEAKQITLVGYITQNHSVDQIGKWLYFSSNRAGNYHVWRKSLKNSTLEQLTKGMNNDSYPVTDTKGNLYFIRHSSSGITELMQSDVNKSAVKIKIPENITDIRNLRITY